VDDPNNAPASRDPKTGRFLPGNKAGGRTYSLVSLVRSQTKDGKELVDFMLRVLRGKEEDADLKARMQAAEWLADRGFGRPVQVNEFTGANGGPLEIAYVDDWRNVKE
jgi:hypothetical protein